MLLALPAAAIAQERGGDAARSDADRTGDDGDDDGDDRGGDDEARDEGGDRARSERPSGRGKTQVFDFTGLDIRGQLRTPQLLYFLDRAREELRQAALERRSFIPEMVRSVEEESL